MQFLQEKSIFRLVESHFIIFCKNAELSLVNPFQLHEQWLYSCFEFSMINFHSKPPTMETQILQCQKIQERIFGEVRTNVLSLKQSGRRLPGIAFVAFEGVALAKYSIPLHLKVAQDAGFHVLHEILPADVALHHVYEVIDRFNLDDTIDAIVIMQPLPAHLDPMLVENRIDVRKEVEGFHPLNMLGTMVPQIGVNPYPMCLPEALKLIYEEAHISIEKDQAWLFILDDEFFSNPLTSMIVRTCAAKVVPKDSPLMVVNKEAARLGDFCKQSDFVVVVSKHPTYLDPGWLKQGCHLIDIYSNLVREVPSKADPAKLVPVIKGGVSVEAVSGIAASIIPIPGGLMTVVLALLLRNTLIAFTKK